MPTRAEPSFAADPADRALPPPPRRGTGVALVALAAVAIAAAAAWWWSRPAPPATVPVHAVAPAPAPTAAPAEEVILHPLEPEPTGPLASATEADQALRDLLGADAVLRYLHVGDFPRRFVATVDNLARDHAPVTMWPVQPSPGRFAVEASGEGQRIATANAQRYRHFVAFASAVDAQAAANLYRRMYPLLQASYEELGFGKRYFNDRVVEVIDLLLATPEPGQAPRVRLTQVKGPIPSERPWTRYEFVDPELQSLAAGQKVLLRLAPEQRGALKAKLRELRAEIASPAMKP